MKKLLLLLFFSGSLDGFSQVKNDTTFLGNDVYMIVNKDSLVGLYRTPPKPDTLPSTILITRKPPSFTHAIEGYCIYQGGVCTGKHLRYWRKTWVRIGPEYMVWGCKRREVR